MKKARYFLTALALTTVIGASLGNAWAYFTTYTQAEGGAAIHLGDRTEITEGFSDWTKHVTVASEADSEPVYIRVRAFCGSQYTLEYAGEGWTLNNDGYYYYNNIVYGGGATGTLDLHIGNIPEDPEDLDRFNVVVIYESVPVKYHEDGTAYSVYETNWEELLDTGSVEGGR